jgi:hypothetical protein
MTRDEAISVVAYIMAAFPNAAKWEDAAIELWADDLEECDHLRARRAVKVCRHEHDYLSFAKFMDAYRQCTRTELAPERQLFTSRALSEAPADPEAVKRIIHMARNAIKRVPEGDA